MNLQTVINLIKEEKKKDKRELDFLIKGDGIVFNSFPLIEFNNMFYLESNVPYSLYSRSYSKKVKLMITDEDESVSLILFYGDSKIQCHTITNKKIYHVMFNCNVERSCAIILLLENNLDMLGAMRYYRSNKKKLKKYCSV